MAENISKIGYVPYQGITQAALTPQMEAGMRGVDSAASAFGLPNAGGDLGLPAPITNQAGFSGYSPYAQYQQEIGKIAPGQMDAINSFVIDPQSGLFNGQGQFGGNAAAQAPAFQNTGQTDDAYLRWISANHPGEMTWAQQHGMAYMDPHGEGSRLWSGMGEVAGDPGSLGGYGQPGSMGAFGDALGSIGNAFGDAFGEAFGQGPGSPAGTPSAAGAGAAEAAGFGGGDFGGF